MLDRWGEGERRNGKIKLVPPPKKILVLVLITRYFLFSNHPHHPEKVALGFTL